MSNNTDNKANKTALLPQKDSSAYKYDFELFGAYVRAGEYEQEAIDRQRRARRKSDKLEVKKNYIEQKRLKEQRVSRERRRQQERSAVIKGLAIGAFVAVLAVNLVCYIVLNELTAKVSEETKKYNELVQAHDSMIVSLETNMSSIAVEEYALGLGMQRREASQTQWVSISNGDIFETASGHRDTSESMPGILSFFGR